MTESAVVICRRCGFGNVPGDRFCGSCGAFLEWEGEAETAPGPAPEPVPSPVLEATPAVAEPVPAAPAGASAPAPASPGPVAPAAQDGAPGDLVRCPVCGTANLPTRTFCQSCGGKLAGAARVAEMPADRIAAAVAAVPAPRPRAAAVSGPASARPVAKADAPRSGGIPGWLIAMILLGVIVGVAVVAASTLLRSEGPATQATDAPHTAPPSGVSQAGIVEPLPWHAAVSGVTIVVGDPAVQGFVKPLCSASMHGERGLSGGGDA